MSKLIIHDLENLPFKAKEIHTVFPTLPITQHCIGCFGCWIKTPGKCIIQDEAQVITELIAQAEEVIIISKCVYGGYSPSIKSILDRSIGYVLPYFRSIEDEMHHELRYDTSFKLSIHFYGPTTATEKEIAYQLLKANAINFGCPTYDINFYSDQKEISL